MFFKLIEISINQKLSLIEHLVNIEITSIMKYNRVYLIKTYNFDVYMCLT